MLAIDQSMAHCSGIVGPPDCVQKMGPNKAFSFQKMNQNRGGDGVVAVDRGVRRGQLELFCKNCAVANTASRNSDDIWDYSRMPLCPKQQS